LEPFVVLAGTSVIVLHHALLEIGEFDEEI